MTPTVTEAIERFKNAVIIETAFNKQTIFIDDQCFDSIVNSGNDIWIVHKEDLNIDWLNLSKRIYSLYDEHNGWAKIIL